jgi:spore coat protein U-like protein
MSLTICLARRGATILALLIALFAHDAARTRAHAVGVMTCTFTITNIAFGSIDVLPGAAFTSNGTLQINCNGLEFLPTTIYACVTLPTPYAMTGPSSPTLQYNLLGPPPSTSTWSNTTAIAFATSGSTVSFTASTTVNVAATVLAGQQTIPPGSYSQTINATMTYSTSTCTTGLIVSNASTSFQVSATVVKSCNVSASNLSFGTFGDLNTAIPGQTGIGVQCSNGIGYAIGLNGGLSNASNPTQRKMTSGANAVTYGLYQDSHDVTPWDNASDVVAGTGTAVSQPYSIYGLVPVQPTPPIGTYSDTIVVSVKY